MRLRLEGTSETTLIVPLKCDTIYFSFMPNLHYPQRVGVAAFACWPCFIISSMNNELQLDITWDPIKAQSNITKHGVTFMQASSVLLDALALTVFDAEHSDLEERWFTLGTSSDGKLLAVSHTYQSAEPYQVRVRIISARQATKSERQQYANEPH